MRTDNITESDITDITLEPGIYDLTPSIKEYVEKGIPLSDEVNNIMRTFDSKYSLDDDINKTGKETILNELTQSLEGFNLHDAAISVEEGIQMAQTINPDLKIEQFPIVFLWTPTSKGGTALHGQGCAINIGKLKDSDYAGTMYENIKEITAHEATHLFLQQLGVRPSQEEGKTLKKEVLDILWEEGLATYIESATSVSHKEIVADADFWLRMVNRWLDANTFKEKYDVLLESLEPKYIIWKENVLNRIHQRNLDPFSIDQLLVTGLLRRPGIGYHLGSYIWEKQVEKAMKEGRTLKDLVMAGSGQMEEWMKI